MATHREIQARIDEISADLRLAIYMRDALACVYCSDSLAMGATLELDHVRPRLLGGTTHAGNLLTCCRACNLDKRHLTFRTFLLHLADYGRLPEGLEDKVVRALTTSIEPYLAQARETIERGK